MIKDLVTIVTPCFNGEKYMIPFMDAVLVQTYRPIEFIFVNDGSTDRTEEIALSYTEKFSLKTVRMWGRTFSLYCRFPTAIIMCM